MELGRPLRGVVVGYGFIGSLGHVPAYLEREDFEIVAVVDLCSARRERAAQNLSLRVYPSFVALLDSFWKGEIGEIDFVDICTPPSDHARIARAALMQGWHVLCEKPLTCLPQDATDLIRLAQASRRVLFPCHNYHYAPVIRAIREFIANDRIGRVHSVGLSTFRTTHAKGVSEWKPDWRRDMNLSGGGIAMDHGSHSFYLTFEWMKAYPTAVTAKTTRSTALFDTEDGFNAVVSFPTGTANVHLSWTAGVRKVIYTLQGEKGAITVDDDRLQIHGLGSAEVETHSIASRWMDASHVSWFGSLLDEFRQAILKNDFVNRSALDALRCVQLIDCAYRSAREGSREILISNDLGPHRLT